MARPAPLLIALLLSLLLGGCGDDDEEVATGGGEGAIVVNSPEPGATVSSPVTVSGSASVFEGTVQIRILGADGAEVGRAFATATAGAPERGRFSADVEFDVEGAEDGAVEAFSQNVASPEESPQRKLFRVEVPVRLEP
jgi:hypothetical protein